MRVTRPRLDLAKDTVKGVVGLLKQFNVVFGTSDAVLCFVNMDVNVTCVTWILCLG